MSLPDTQADRTSALRQLIDTLFDFESLPGRYPLTLREPRILFDASHDVLLLAASRPVKGLALELTDMPRLKRAACFFVRAAMLRSGSDHYTVLGLEQGFNKNSLRLHYRILIRLTHPDFVGNSEAWPAGAATRINLAHDVLSSAVRQAEYNRTLPGIERRSFLPAQRLAAVLPRPVANRYKHFKYKVWAFSSAGVFTSLLFAVLWSSDTDDRYEDGVAQIELADSLGTAVAESRNSGRVDIERQANSWPSSPAPSLGSANKQLKDAKATGSRDESADAGLRAMQTRQTQLAKESREAKEAEAAKLVRSVKATQDAKTTELAHATASKQAQLAYEATLLRAKLPDAPVQAASQSPAATLLVQPAKAAQPLLEAKPGKPGQVPKPIQVAQLALAVQLSKNVEVSATEAVSINVSALSVKPPPAQPVNDAPAKLSLVDAQPALNQLIQSMQAGRGEELLRGLDRSLSRSSGATDVVNAYNVLIGGSRAVRVGRIQLRGRPVADYLTVDGVVQLILQDQGQPLPVRELPLRATFVLRDGQVVMTELSTSNARP